MDKSPQRGLRIGESLPPDAHQVLRDLEIWDQFVQGPHLECYGNQSVWGSAEMHYTDFIQHPIGKGWHVDREAFEKHLLEEALRSGVRVQWGCKVKSVEGAAGKWQVQLEADGPTERTAEFDFLVDASGRNSWLSRRLGADRLYEDQQISLVTFLRCGEDPGAAPSLIEAAPDGWWYSAPLPQQRMATAFMCTPSAAQRQAWTSPEGWQRLVAQAPHTQKRLAEAQAEWIDPPQFVAADSGISERIVGANWLAVGDAAMCYDPLASHGIQMALVGARQAASSIVQCFNGNPHALKAYQNLMFRSFATYAQERQKFYRSERRFPQSPYWAGRVPPVAETP